MPKLALARCHQRKLPIVDGAGRPLVAGAWVKSRRYASTRRRNEEVYGDPIILEGAILHLFDFDDHAPPEIEVRAAETGRIFTAVCHYTGGCWKFETLLLCQSRSA